MGGGGKQEDSPKGGQEDRRVWRCTRECIRRREGDQEDEKLGSREVRKLGSQEERKAGRQEGR